MLLNAAVKVGDIREARRIKDVMADITFADATPGMQQLLEDLDDVFASLEEDEAGALLTVK
jgi:hypothetical protein